MSQTNLPSLLLDQSKDFVWTVDIDFNLIYANSSYLSVVKMVTGKEQLLNESAIVEGYDTDHIEKWKEFYRRGLRGESFQIEEHFYNQETNEVQYGQTSLHPLRNENNEIFAVACQSKDITSLIKQRWEANHLMDASLDVFCTINQQGNFVYVNAAAEDHWGYLPEQLIGKAYMEMVLEEDVMKTNEIAASILTGKEVKSFINRYNKKDGGIAFNLWSVKWDAAAKLMYCVVRDAKEIIQQEEKLLHSEERFKALVQEGSDLIAIIDEEGIYTYVSPTSTTILGIPPHEFIGRNAFEFIHPDDVEKTLASLKSIVKKNRVMLDPFRFLNKEKEFRWIETILTNMLDNPAVNGVVANSRDITEWVNARKETEASEEFNRTVLESSPDCLNVLNQDGRIQYMNVNGLCQMEIDDFGALKNKSWWTLWGSENEELVKSSVDKALKGQTVNFTAFCPTAKGTPKWWDVLVSPVGKAGKSMQQIISVSRDITQQKEEEQRLKLLESVITNTNDSVLITDVGGLDETGHRIIFVNQAFTKMTGYAAEEVIGKSPNLLQGPNSNKEALQKLSEAIKNWQPYEVTTINYKKSGEEFWVNFSVQPVADEKGWYTHWIAIERDVTEQKINELEKELFNKISKIFNDCIDHDLTACLNKLCEHLNGFGKFDFAEMWLPEIDAKTINLVTKYAEGSIGQAFVTATENFNSGAFGDGMPGNVWKNKATEIWKTTEGHWYPERKKAAKKAGIKSIIGIPLIDKEDVIGVLILGTVKTRSVLKLYLGLSQRLESFIGGELSRKKIEIELAQIFDSAPDMICVADFNGYLKRVNPAGLTLLGYSLEELKSRPIRSFIHEDDRERTKEQQHNLYNGGKQTYFENRYITKQGEIVWLSWTATSAPEHGIVYAVAKNITEEKKLRELNRQVGILAKIGSWEIDVPTKTVFWSEEIHQLHETDSKTFEPDLQTGFAFYREDFRQLVRHNFENSTITGKPFDFEAVLVTATKKEVWVRVIGNSEMVAGVSRRIYGSVQDITTLKESENRLVSLSENLPGVVYQYIISPDGTDALRKISGAVEQVWGFSANEVLDNNNLVWDQIRKGGQLEEVKASILHSIQTKARWTSRMRYVMPTGEVRTHLGSGLPRLLSNGNIIYNAIVLDITLEAKNEELLNQASQMARIGSWEMDLINHEGDSMYWSPMVREIVEVDDSYDPTLTGGIEFHVGESKERIEKALNLLITEGVEFDEEILLRTAKGNERWSRAIGKSEMVNNKRTKIYGSYQDIDEKKRSAIKLAESENRFRTILDAEPECIKLLNEESELLMINPAGLDMIEAESEDQVLGKSLLGVVLPEYREAFSSLTKKIFKGETGTLVFEIKGLKGTERWVETHAVPMRNEQGKIESLLGVTRDITERKTSEKTFRDSEEKRRLIMSGALDAIITIDIKGMVTFWNPQAEVIFGWKETEVLGKKLSDLIVPEKFRKYHDEGIKKYLKTGEGKAINALLDLSAVRQNGEEFPIELTVIPIKQGSEEFFCAFIREITQRKRAEQEKNILQKTLENSLNEIYVFDPETFKFVYVNKGALLNIGYSENEVKTLTPLDLKPDFTEKSFRKMVTPLIIGNKGKIIFFTNQKRKDGSLYPVEAHLQLVTESEHKRFLVIILDITERKKAEEENRFKANLLSTIGQAAISTDLNGVVNYWNKAAENIYGWKQEEAIGQSILQLTPLQTNQSEAMQIMEALKKGETWSGEFEVCKKDGSSFPAFISNSPTYDEHNVMSGILGISSDITSEVKNRELLNKYTLELERSNQELEQFAFVASHDLQEPLRMISSFMDQLKRKYGDALDEKGHQYIHFATDGAKRMKQIILDLLQYSRASRTSEGKELVDMNKLLDEYKQLRTKIISETSASIISEKLPTLDTYKAAVTQIFHCLLDNAIKYTIAGKAPIVEIDGREKEAVWEFSIRDNGIGIDAQFFDKIFVIFQRLHNKEEYQGTGIGLSVAKRHIEFLGGQIWLDSEPGQGSIFYFTIPKTK